LSFLLRLSPARSISIVAETAELLVVDKPPFIEVHPSKPNGRFTLWHGLRELLAFEIANGGQVSLINRLDRETSGLMLVAKTRDAARRLHRQMEARRIAKEYLAIVWGWPGDEEFSVDAPLLRQGSHGPSRIYLKQAVHPDGAAARTRFRVVRRFERDSARFAVIHATPETGRMHQIRVHLSHAGHAIVGDKIYGPDEGCYLEFIKTGWTPALAARLLLPRQALHSAMLHLLDTGAVFRSPFPADLSGWAGENLLVTPSLPVL
jgi:23S rRNA pseudouridine1911/1915/1917 synthase